MSVFKQTAASSGGDYENAPVGNHPAVLVAMIDIGTHEEDYQGAKKQTRKIYLAWELVDEKKADGKNHVISKTYTLSLHKKAGLRKLIEDWRGKPLGETEEFDLTKVVGKPCLLNVAQKQAQSGSTYSYVASVGPLPKNMKATGATYIPVCWELEGNKPTPREPWLPFIFGEAVDSVIGRCAERRAASQQADTQASGNHDDDTSNENEIPF